MSLCMHPHKLLWFRYRLHRPSWTRRASRRLRGHMKLCSQHCSRKPSVDDTVQKWYLFWQVMTRDHCWCVVSSLCAYVVLLRLGCKRRLVVLRSARRSRHTYIPATFRTRYLEGAGVSLTAIHSILLVLNRPLTRDSSTLVWREICAQVIHSMIFWVTISRYPRASIPVSKPS
ncbi:hypothetical protein BDV06DRAFT_85896 [Aspergillus oleicola]